jgi:probable rRNA maturation factor
MTLSLSVQYASRAAHLPDRTQLRRWASATCAVASEALRLKALECEFTIRYMDEREGRELNHSFRRKDYATNVLTFVDSAGGAPPVRPSSFVSESSSSRAIRATAKRYVADIAICAPVVAREAKAQRKTIHAHHAHMVVHGMLHALGFDHENEIDAARMEALETRVLQRFRINNPYE